MQIPWMDFSHQFNGQKQVYWRLIQQLNRRGDFILGEEVARFEQEFAKYCGARYGIGVNSGTDAMWLSLTALGIGPGDEVITSSFTYIATAIAIALAGAKPVLVDIDPVSYNLNPKQAADAVTPKTKAILPVHLYGQAADMMELKALAKRRKLWLIEDAAQAHGAEYRNRKVGNLGDVGCFSFYPTKNLGCWGDGGIVVTNLKSAADRLRMLRDHGRKEKYLNLVPGQNSRLDTLQAAILRVKLKSLDRWNQKRRELARYYTRQIQKHAPGVVTPVEQPGKDHVYHLYVVRVKNRDQIQSRLASRGIQTVVNYPKPYYLQPAFRYLGYRRGAFPVTEQVSDEVLSLPLYPDLSKQKIDYIVRQLVHITRRY